MSLIYHFNHKAIISGNLVEVFKYENTQYFNYNRKSFNSNTHNQSVSTVINRDVPAESVDRAIKRVKRLIASNINAHKDNSGDQIKSKFITFTFKCNIKTEDTAKKYIKAFNEKLKRKFSGFKPAYINVFEKQKNGRIHIHSIYFNMPYISYEDLLNLWPNGGIHINAIGESIEDINRISKYLTKDFNKREHVKM